MIPETLASAVVVAPGARAAEAKLFAELGEKIERRDAALQVELAAGDAAAVRERIARPLRIVVPSSRLRDHVSEALLRHFGRSLAAVVVQTQRALALAVVERNGCAPDDGEELLRLLLRRFAADEPLLAAALGALREGYGIVEATARDLIDAGIEAHSAEALDDLLAEQASAGAERVRAVVRVTMRAIAALEREGRAPRTALLKHAIDVVRAQGESALPTAALWVHGFADATGVVADWIEAVLRGLPARVLVDAPPDPYAAGATETEFSLPFVERMERAAGALERAPADPVGPASIALLRAPGAVAEVRAVALRIRALLAAGVAPEAIGVVARNLDPYRAALDANFARLAIPFSAPGAAGSPDAQSRRLASAAQLLAEADLTPVDVWLATSEHPEDGDGDLRVGLHGVGAARLVDLAQLDVADVCGGEDFIPLPVRRGSADDADADAADDAAAARRAAPRVRSRSLSRSRLERAQQRARGLVRRMQDWPAVARFADHHERLMRLVGEDLGWRPGAALAAALAFLDALRDDAPDDFVLTRVEFAGLVARALERAHGSTLGGAGAGVQVLSVMSARGRSFDALFVLGLQRDVFPRTPTEDPIVCDALRRAMRVVLPELPVKAQGHAEERHLFADLLSSSPAVVLSWQHVSDEGREVPQSSFVTRLRLAHPSLAIEVAPPSLGARDADTSVRPAHEHAIRAALQGARAALAPIRSEALREVREALAGDDAGIDVAALARVQLAILDEIDPDRRTRAGRVLSARLGPYFGYVGPRAAPDESTRPELYVTRLEDLARCPWQTFLRRELRLEPMPDALDSLPALAPSVIGNVVHAVLQQIVDDAIGGERLPLRDAFARGAVRVPWPDAARIAAIALEQATRIAAEDGVRIAGFARALAQRARAMVEVARISDWGDASGLEAFGAELDGDLVVQDAAGRARRIGFRVDRADRAEGALRLTDYKTGKPLGSVVGDETKRRKLLEAVEQGRGLQAAAYLAGARAIGADRAEGRLFYVGEGIDERSRAFVARPEDERLVAAFEATARTAFAALDAGALFPRLVMAEQDKEPAACGWCEVAVACLRGETSQRARLRAWATDTDARSSETSDASRALHAVFALGRELAARPEGGS